MDCQNFHVEGLSLSFYTENEV